MQGLAFTGKIRPWNASICSVTSSVSRLISNSRNGGGGGSFLLSTAGCDQVSFLMELDQACQCLCRGILAKMEVPSSPPPLRLICNNGATCSKLPHLHTSGFVL